MKRFAFISRHEPTARQVSLAEERGIELVHVGDRDAFRFDPNEFAWKRGQPSRRYDGAIVVHAAMALRLVGKLSWIGVFENGARENGGFEPVALHVYEDHSTDWGAQVEEIHEDHA
jgi:hypothetical protein